MVLSYLLLVFDCSSYIFFFFFQAEDGIRDLIVTGVQTCALPIFGLGAVDEQQLYGALDWLVEQQERIEKALARRHLKNGTLVLYDVSSTYLEGRTCELAQFGHNRDGKHGKLQIVFGLLCSQDGCPVAIEVFEGNVGDPSTLQTQIAKLKERFESVSRDSTSG